MKKRLFALFLFVLVFLLSGCSNINADLSGYIKPPQNSKEMQLLQGAIKKAIGDTATMLFPASGTYRNSIVLKDIDNDNIDEAAVSYSSPAAQKQAHILILKKTRGTWVTTNDITGSGSDIDIIDFNDFNKDGKLELIVGWSLTNSESKGLSVYSLSDNSSAELLSLPYSFIYIPEFSKDSSGILLLNSDKKSLKANAKLIMNVENKPKVVSECETFYGVLAYNSVVFGSMGKSNAFYIDSSLDEVNMQTEILEWNGSELKNLTFSGGKLLFEADLKRTSNLLCQDIDGDKIVEIPKTITAIDTQPLTLNDVIMPTKWYYFNGKEFIHDFYSVINTSERYYFTIPEKWINLISIKKDTTKKTISFYLKGESADKNELLFSIFSFNQTEWQTGNGSNGYLLIKEFTDRIYAVKFSESGSVKARELIPKLDEVKALFVQATVNQK